jgi:iron(III) transport system ATP-binding protein
MKDSMGNGIELRDITKRYGNGRHSPWAVRGIGFEVPAGTLTTLLGPPGCGKTTTLRLIAGLESPTSGSILIDGRDVTELGPGERNVSMVFQSGALFPHMHVLDNVSYGLRMGGMRKDEAAARAREALESVGLVDLDRRLPGELSDGQRQRVAVARSLVLEPAVLLFDEPLSGLDTRLRREMREEIRNLQQRLQLTVVHVTHDQAEALALSDQVIVMDDGAIAQRGTPEELYGRPESEFVAGFMGEAMVLPALVQEEGRVELGPITLVRRYDLPPGIVKVAVRPEAWQIGAAIGLPATLRKASYLGSFHEYTFDTPLGPVFVVSTNLSRPLAAGAQTTLGLDTHGVTVLPASP